MSRRLHSLLGSAVGALVAATAAGCGGPAGGAPSPVVNAPAATPSPPPPVFHFASGSLHYQLRSDAAITMPDDSAPQRDSLATDGWLTVQVPGGDSLLRLSGTVDSLTVRSLERGTPPRTLAGPVAFTRSAEVRGDTLLVVVGDTTAGCDSDSASVATVVADLLPAVAPSTVPDTAAVSVSRVQTCRGPIPVTIDAVTRPVMDSAATGDGASATTASHLTISGSAVRGAHAVSLIGSGELRTTYALDPVTGVIRTVSASYRLEYTLLTGVTSRRISERGVTRLMAR